MPKRVNKQKDKHAHTAGQAAINISVVRYSADSIRPSPCSTDVSNAQQPPRMGQQEQRQPHSPAHAQVTMAVNPPPARLSFGTLLLTMATRLPQLPYPFREFIRMPFKQHLLHVVFRQVFCRRSRRRGVSVRDSTAVMYSSRSRAIRASGRPRRLNSPSQYGCGSCGPVMHTPGSPWRTVSTRPLVLPNGNGFTNSSQLFSACWYAATGMCAFTSAVGSA